MGMAMHVGRPFLFLPCVVSLASFWKKSLRKSEKHQRLFPESLLSLRLKPCNTLPMNNGPIDEYRFTTVELSPLIDWIQSEGKVRMLEKKEYLVRQNGPSPMVGLLEEGICRFLRTDAKGNEHVVGYTFSGSLVGEYTANLCARSSLVDIQAVTPCRLRLVSYARMREWMAARPDGDGIGRILAEQMFVLSYKRLLDSYCCTPEERYRDLMAHYPELKELRPLKEIASFIGVTPETVSTIRRKIRRESKS